MLFLTLHQGQLGWIIYGSILAFSREADVCRKENEDFLPLFIMLMVVIGYLYLAMIFFWFFPFIGYFGAINKFMMKA